VLDWLVDVAASLAAATALSLVYPRMTRAAVGSPIQ
jgi:hypothetical protein